MTQSLRTFIFLLLTAASGVQAQHLRALAATDAKVLGRNPTNLGLCQGDCDDDDDCNGNLVCHQRDSGDNAPGCNLNANQRKGKADFCVRPNGGGGGDDETTGGSNTADLVSNGQTGLEKCQGDCDYDSDCKGSMVCYQRDEGEDLPGCSLSNDLKQTDGDFCVPGHADGHESFALKMHWKPHYFWQEERDERKWCMSCRGPCRDGNEIAIFDCDEFKPTQWVFVKHGNNNVQIKVQNRNVCIEDTGDNDLELRTCDENEPTQRFMAFGQGKSFSDDIFEISPRPRMGICFTQRHHPKRNESVNLETCNGARKSDTSYWEKY